MYADGKYYDEDMDLAESAVKLKISFIKAYENGSVYKLSMESLNGYQEGHTHIYLYVTAEQIYRIYTWTMENAEVIYFDNDDERLKEILDTDEKIIDHADIVCQEEEQRINLTEFLDMTKCSTKSYWKNFLSVIKHFSYRNRFRCMDVLFTFLQDANWPVYDDTVDFLCSFDEADILSYIGLYLEKAHERKDEIWEENIYHLINRLGVEALNLP